MRAYELRRVDDYKTPPTRWFLGLRSAKRAIPNPTAPCRRVRHNELIYGHEKSDPELYLGRWKYPVDVWKGWGDGHVWYIKLVEIDDNKGYSVDNMELMFEKENK